MLIEKMALALSSTIRSLAKGSDHRPIIRSRFLSRIWGWKACRIPGFETAEPLSEHIGFDMEGMEATAVDSELRSDGLGEADDRW